MRFKADNERLHRPRLLGAAMFPSVPGGWVVTVALDAVDHLPVAVESTKASSGPAPSVVTTSG